MGKAKGRGRNILNEAAGLGDAGEAPQPGKKAFSSGEQLQQQCFGCICVENRLRSVFFR